jgi:hypothetical protein
MKFDKVYHAFAISNDYVEYSFDNSGLNEYIDSPTGTILALRRVTKEGGKAGKYTVIGCFLSAKDVPGAKAVKRKSLLGGTGDCLFQSRYCPIKPTQRG